MTVDVRQFLESFDALRDADKHQVTVEILRRTTQFGSDLSEEALVEIADELFRDLDAAEEGHAQP